MDPMTLTAAGLATSLLTKTLEKAAEKLGEQLPDLGAKALKKLGLLKQLLWRKSPETASAMERVVHQPELMDQQPEEYGVKALVEKLDAVAKADSEVSELLDEVENEVRPKIPSEVSQEILARINLEHEAELDAGNITVKRSPKSGPTDLKLLADVDIKDKGKLHVKDIHVES